MCASGLYQALAQYSSFPINMGTIINIDLLTHSFFFLLC